MSVSLNTVIKPRPDVNKVQDLDARHHIEAEGEAYDDAYQALMAQVPDGWLVVGLKRW